MPCHTFVQLTRARNRNVLLNVREIAVVQSFERGNRFDLWFDPPLAGVLKVLDVILEGRGQRGHNVLLQGNACLFSARHPTKHQT